MIYLYGPPPVLPAAPAWATPQPNAWSTAQPMGSVVVRHYGGGNAQQAFQLDATQMSAAGWFPITQSWIEGQRSAALLILGIIGLLFFIIPGLIILVIWAAYRGAGSLTVTYQYRQAP